MLDLEPSIRVQSCQQNGMSDGDVNQHPADGLIVTKQTLCLARPPNRLVIVTSRLESATRLQLKVVS